ncbi:MAG: potassium channel family protein [Ilumatobacter sp.]
MDDQNAKLVKWRHRTDTPLLIVAIGSLPFLALEFARDDLVRSDRLLLDVINVTVLVVFAVDYIVGFALSTNRRRYVRTEWAAALIVAAQALVFVPSLVGFGALRIVRGARLVRIVTVTARMLAIGGATRAKGQQALKREAGNLALGTAAFTWISAAVAFTLAEDVGEGQRVVSFFDALWWSSATITTVGYGDIFPVTTVGRLVGMVTMFVGISAFAVVTAKIAEWLVGGKSSTA